MKLMLWLLCLGLGAQLLALPTHLVPYSVEKRVAWGFPGRLKITFHEIAAGEVMIRALDEAPTPRVSFHHALPARFHFFTGTGGHISATGYRQVVFHEVYPGIHRMVTGLENGQVALAWYVEPGADPSRIRFQVLSENYTWSPTTIRTRGWALENLRAYQGLQKVAVAFQEVAPGIFRFALGAYDPSEPLVIDPDLTLLEASTYLGGSNTDEIQDLAVSSDAVYVVGTTASPDFPTSATAYDRTHNGGTYDVFVAKFSQNLDTLYAATFLGGSGSDRGMGIDLTASGRVVVTGQTFSSDFPMVHAYQNTLGGPADAFVAVLSSNLNQLLSSTYLGGSDVDWANDVVVVPGDTVFLCGATYSSDFPLTAGALDASYTGGKEGFLSALGPDLSTLEASTYVGGSSDEELYELFVHPTNLTQVYAVGYSSSTDIPMSNNGYDTDVAAQDAYVLRTNRALNTLVAATFFGEQGPSYLGYVTTGYTLTLTPSGAVVIGGEVTCQPGATVLPIIGGFDPTPDGYTEGFVAIFDSSLQNLLASTYVGGSADDRVLDLEWTATTYNTLLVTGATSSSDMPYHSSLSPYDANHNGNDDAFVYTLAEDLSQTYGFTYYGGSRYDEARAVVPLPNSLVIAGVTDSSVLPMVSHAYDNTPNGPSDGFLVRFNNTGPPPTSVVEGDLQKPGFGIRALMNGRLQLTLQRASYVGLEVYTVDGRLVAQQTLGVLPAGTHELELPKVPGVLQARVRIGDQVVRVRALQP